MRDKLDKIKTQFNLLTKQLQEPNIINNPEKIKKVSQKYSDLKEIMELITIYDNNVKKLDEAKEILQTETDKDLLELAEQELKTAEEDIKKNKEELKIALIPKNPLDKKSIILEIRAGAGGDESALFAADLFRLYTKIAEQKSWKINILSSNKIGIGGFKEIISEISGKDVYGFLKYEKGVHRVQRVPNTEKSGRIHTSTTTVAVMPEAEEIDLKINPNDLRVDTFCAGGHGGQGVNTTYSAVRITHLPTNIVSQCQDERSQIQNKEKAMIILRSRLLNKLEEEQNNSMADNRKQQVGSGDRSEKIRTYNYPQDRITDHRIPITLHNLDNFMNGEVDYLINELQIHYQNLALIQDNES